MNKHWTKGKRLWKGAALAGTLGLCLTLSACYIPPDEISTDTQSMTIGSNNLPFDPIPSPTPTPSATPTAVPSSGQAGAQPTINWNWGDNPSETATVTPAPWLLG